MKFEVLKKSHLKRNLIIGVIVVLILNAVILTFTRANYRVTESIPLVSGTISFSPYDFNVVAMYLNKNGESIVTKKAPHVGYTLNEEQSTCVVDDEEVQGYEIVYNAGLLNFNNLSQSGTKCSVYFDLIPDSENPIISDLKIEYGDTSITVIIDGLDNIGIYYYYFKLDNGEEIKLEKNTYTFEGLEKDSVHTISVRIEDAAGNEAVADKKVTVGIKGKDVILTHFTNIETRTDFNRTVTATTTGTIYKSANESQYDNDGEVYYFAGKPTDNWLYFAGFYWRIIRINGDGTIRLIFTGSSTNQTGYDTMINAYQEFNSSTENVGYMYRSGQVHGLQYSSDIKTTIDNWYNINLIEEEEYLDGNAGFCGDRTPYSGSGTGGYTDFAANNRLDTNKNPSYKCSDIQDLYTTKDSVVGNKALDKPIGLITADEVTFAGASGTANNSEFYLCNGYYYYTITPSRYYASSAYIFRVAAQGWLQDTGSGGNRQIGVRPVINLRADVELTGSGTTSDPFKVIGAS